jgi:hypothetical protein
LADQFFPANFDQAPVMPVEATLYTIRATLLNPETGISMPAPDHVWLLVDVSQAQPLAISRSTPSDASGTSSIGVPTPLPGRYSLVFFPAPDPAKTKAPDAELIRSVYRQKDGEAWIDLDQPDRWAVAPTSGSLELRRLFRVPAWSTSRKASLGGFKVVPPNTSRFARQGIILGSELAKFGPWDMPLDFNWAMAKVEFSFVDWQQNQFETLPPGLIVEARRTLKGGASARVAAGVTAAVASKPPTPGAPQDRSAYLLLEGDKTLWKECHIQFSTPGRCFVDLSSKATPSPDNRIKQGQSSQPLDDFNPLPLDWHSFGMRGSFTTTPKPSGASPPAPPGATSPRSPDKLWDGLRFDLAKAADGDNATISFSIDDIVLCDAASTPLKTNRTAPITLFDHLLTIINPDPNAPYQSLTKRVGLVIPAADALQIPAVTGATIPPPRVGSTRLVHCEGGLHDVGKDRVTIASGALGVVPCIGARAGVLGKHPSKVIVDPMMVSTFAATINLQLHQIDVPEVVDPATKVPLQHLLFYLPVKLGVDPMPNRSATLTAARKLLGLSGDLWSPGHPGVASNVSNKRYALVPRDPAKRNLSIIRLRTFFGERQVKPSLTISHARDTSGTRRPATTSGRGGVPTRIRSFDASVTRDSTPSGPGFGDSGDSVSSPSMEMTHELGHGAFSLNDEYVEFLDTLKGIGIDHSDPLLPSFQQFDEGTTDFRPYYSDAASMMRSNCIPRLRHFWQVTQLFQAQFTLPQPPYDLVHEAFKTTAGTDPVTGAPDPGTSLTYAVAPNNTRSPWPPVAGASGLIFNRPIPNGFGQVALFAVGDDEGTAQRMFKVFRQPIVGLAKENRMQALLIVRSRICFILDPRMTPDEKLAVLHTDFQRKIYESRYELLIRFVLNPRPIPATGIRPPAPGGLHRVAVLFQPHYSVSSSDIAKADIVFDISKTANPPRPNPFAGNITGKRVNVMAADFSFEEAWRLVLGVRNAPPGVIRSTDLDPVTRLLESELGEPANFRQPDIFA